MLIVTESAANVNDLTFAQFETSSATSLLHLAKTEMLQSPSQALRLRFCSKSHPTRGEISSTLLHAPMLSDSSELHPANGSTSHTLLHAFRLIVFNLEHPASAERSLSMHYQKPIKAEVEPE